jgi:hypothetical protein
MEGGEETHFDDAFRVLGEELNFLHRSHFALDLNSEFLF